jgi:hypothetical protein
LMFGLLADRIGDSRRLSEEILYRLRQAETTGRHDDTPCDRDSSSDDQPTN